LEFAGLRRYSAFLLNAAIQLEACQPDEPGIIFLLGSFYKHYGTKVGLPFARERVIGRCRVVTQGRR
jgi:hypothetical protein